MVDFAVERHAIWSVYTNNQLTCTHFTALDAANAALPAAQAARAAADAKATVPAEFVREVAQQCSDLQERGASYQQARVVYGRDPVGNQYRFSANQVALEVLRLQQAAVRYCRPLAAQHLLTELRMAQRAKN